MAKRKAQPRNLVNEFRKVYAPQPDEKGRQGIFFDLPGALAAIVQTDAEGNIIGAMLINQADLRPLAEKLVALADQVFAKAVEKAVPENVAEAHNAIG